MSIPWPQLYQGWMESKGVIRGGVLKDGVVQGGTPRDPLSKNSSKARTQSVNRIMGDLGYIGRGSKPVRDVTPQELIGWIVKKFPDGGWNEPTRWNFYVWGIHKLSEFLHYELKDRKGRPVFSAKDLYDIKEGVRLRPVDKDEPPTLSKDFIQRYEKFLTWLKSENPYLYAVGMWSFLSCMRFDEVARMDGGLKTGSAIRQADGTLEVEGKRDRGRRVKRDVPVGKDADAHLKWWMGFRRRKGLDAEALFVTSRTHTRWTTSVVYNRQLRRYANQSGLFKGSCDYKGDAATGELELIKSHWMGRHAGATALGYGGADIILIKRQTGHKRIDILDGRYLNLDAAEVAKSLDKHRGGNGNGGSSDQVDKDSLAKEILADPELRQAIIQQIREEVLASLGGGS